jgi:hypothetical protein
MNKRTPIQEQKMIETKRMKLSREWCVVNRITPVRDDLFLTDEQYETHLEEQLKERLKNGTLGMDLMIGDCPQLSHHLKIWMMKNRAEENEAYKQRKKAKKRAPTHHKERVRFAFKCPECKTYSTHNTTREKVRLNMRYGSKLQPIKGWCDNHLGICTTTGNGNGKRSVHTMSRNNDHRIAWETHRRGHKMTELIQTLNEELEENPDKIHTKEEMYVIHQPDWKKGESIPRAFRLGREI